MALIVIEGPDGTGKTTLARALEQEGFRYVHNGPPSPDEDLFATYTEQLLKAINSDKPTVFDRLHVGELVYGEVMRGKSKINIEQMRLLNRLIYSVGGRIIYCDSPFPVILNNWKKRRAAEYVDDEKRLKRIKEGYAKIFGDEVSYDIFSLPTFNYTDHTANGTKIQQLAQTVASKQTSRRRCPKGVIGNPTGPFIIVGEQVRNIYGNDLAFYSHRGSPHFLNELLWEAGFQEHELAFTNALDSHDESRNLRRLWQSLPCPIFITAGKIAHELCNSQGVPHLVMPHPQYIKRFEFRKRKRYVKLLKSYRGE